MTVKISHQKKTFNKSSSNLVLFSNDKFNISNLKNIFPIQSIHILDLLKSSDLKKKLITFELNSKKIILISIKNNLKSSDIENLGADFFKQVNLGKNKEYFLGSDTIVGKYENFIGHFLHGLKLKSYEFKKYKTKKDIKTITVNVFGTKNKLSSQSQLKFKALEEGTFYARDLVSEPGNVLHPDEYAKRLSSLRKDGLKINIYDKKN